MYQATVIYLPLPGTAEHRDGKRILRRFEPQAFLTDALAAVERHVNADPGDSSFTAACVTVVALDNFPSERS